MQVTSAALLSPDDAVIAVSHSGASQELLQSVQAAKDSGASIVVITSHAKSPLAKLADVCPVSYTHLIYEIKDYLLSLCQEPMIFEHILQKVFDRYQLVMTIEPVSYTHLHAAIQVI